MSKQDPKDFVKKLRKSIDFDEVMATIPTEEQSYAETHADEECVEWLKCLLYPMAVGDIQRIPFSAFHTGTIYKKAEGLYDYMVSNQEGQVVLQEPNVTPEIMVKELEIRDFISKAFFVPATPEVEAINPTPLPAHSPTIIRISLGDVQIEIQKSLNAASNSQKTPNTIRKSLAIFRKSTASYLTLSSDSQTAREILNNWDLHGERFNQIMFGVEQISKSKGK